MIDPISKWLFPELKRFDTHVERWRAGEAAHNENRFRFVGAVILTLLVYVALSLLVFWGTEIVRRVPDRSSVATAVCLAFPFVGGVFLGLAPLALVRRSIRRSLRRHLTKAGMPTCVSCGYDLRGQIEPRCPECGSPFHKNGLDDRS